MIEQIKMAIDNIRPSLQADGGDIELVEFKEAENLVLVKLKGACNSWWLKRLKAFAAYRWRKSFT